MRLPDLSLSQWSLVAAVAWLVVLIGALGSAYPRQALIWVVIVGTLASVVRILYWAAEKGDERAARRRRGLR